MGTGGTAADGAGDSRGGSRAGSAGLLASTFPMHNLDDDDDDDDHRDNADLP